jgi:Rrf2 family transcriptional regulator, cysteine metabolism repressor
LFLPPERIDGGTFMKLSTKGKYGVRAVFEIARHYGKGPITIKEIAERQGISFSYLEQILHKLGKSGMIESVRGPAGGYLLARKPAELTIGDIVRTLEGPIALSHCLEPGESEECSQTDACVARMVGAQVGAKIEEALDSISFDDLLRQQMEHKAPVLLKPGKKAAMTGKGVC